MKIATLFTAAAATALIGGAVWAQSPTTTTTTAPAAAPAAGEAARAVAPTGTAVSTSVTTTEASGTTVTTTMTTNGPVPDTPANRVKYGQPMSNAGKHTPAKGN